jgi:hypothetical protein
MATLFPATNQSAASIKRAAAKAPPCENLITQESASEFSQFLGHTVTRKRLPAIIRAHSKLDIDRAQISYEFPDFVKREGLKSLFGVEPLALLDQTIHQGAVSCVLNLVATHMFTSRWMSSLWVFSTALFSEAREPFKPAITSATLWTSAICPATRLLYLFF